RALPERELPSSVNDGQGPAPSGLKRLASSAARRLRQCATLPFTSAAAGASGAGWPLETALLARRDSRETVAAGISTRRPCVTVCDEVGRARNRRWPSGSKGLDVLRTGQRHLARETCARAVEKEQA